MCAGRIFILLEKQADSSFEQNFKNDIYDLLLNNYLGFCELDMSCYCDVIENTILNSSVDSQDIRLFEKHHFAGSSRNFG